MSIQQGLGSFAPVEHDRRPDLDDDPTARPVCAGTFAAAMPELVRLISSKSHIEAHGYADVLIRKTDRHSDEQRGGWSKITISAECPFRVLDLHAGYGVWGSEFAIWWVTVLGLPRAWLHVTGVEINGVREQHLVKWCDDWALDDWRQALGIASGLASNAFDLIIGNPAFSHILRSGKKWSTKANKGKGGWINTKYRPRDETMVPTLLMRAPATLLLHHGGAFDDSENGREVWRAYPPAFQWRLGRLGFRGDGNTDNRPYCATLWLRGHDGSCSTLMLDEPGSRQWSGTPPGAESLIEIEELGLVLAPGYKAVA